MLLAFVLTKSKEFFFRSAGDFGSALIFGVIATVYSFGAVVTLNAAYDSSHATFYSAEVKDKHLSKGKSTTYYLTLAPWGSRKEISDVSVPEAFYNRTAPNDNVQIHLKKGWLDIPWFIVTK